MLGFSTSVRNKSTCTGFESKIWSRSKAQRKETVSPEERARKMEQEAEDKKRQSEREIEDMMAELRNKLKTKDKE